MPPPDETHSSDAARGIPQDMTYDIMAAQAGRRMSLTPDSTDSQADFNLRKPSFDSQIGPSPSTRSTRDCSFSGPPPLAEDVSPFASPFHIPLPYISPEQLAFTALQFLPVPLLVLDSLKTVVLANESMGRLLGLVKESEDDRDDAEAGLSVMGRLRGQSLSQVGIDMLQEGRLVWIPWETFLDSVAGEMGAGKTKSQDGQIGDYAGDRADSLAGADGDGSDTPTVGLPQSGQCGGLRPGTGTTHHPTTSAVVEVVITQSNLSRTRPSAATARPRKSDAHTFAKMIISVWELQDQQTYFTLTFTNTDTTPNAVATTKKSVVRASMLEAAKRKSIYTGHPSSVSDSSRESAGSSQYSFPSPNHSVAFSSTPFPPLGPPPTTSTSNTPSILQKLITMKDAILDNTQMPILAMWKDGSVSFPNKAARKLFMAGDGPESSMDGFELLKRWEVWDEEFMRRLEHAEYPISVLLKTETPFIGMRIGMLGPDNERIVFDVLGEAIRDDLTGEFVGGVVTCRDVTKVTQMLTNLKELDDERFRLICDTMPQLVWTSTPDGSHDFFNNRWYSYTGLSKQDSLGLGWKNPFHPEDMPEAEKRWKHSLATGDPYVVEYRCRSREGEWRWFLGRALPLRDKETQKITKWFGTCTDVHESIEAKFTAKRLREQLLSVIAHAHVTMFTLDVDRKITMLEGALSWDARGEKYRDHQDGSRWYIGQNVYEVFNRLNSHLKEGERPRFLEPIEGILAGRKTEDIQEHGIDGRWYRTRFIPVLGKAKKAAGFNDVASIEGLIGVIFDVTELRAREQDLVEQAKERRQLLANEAAAKEASRLKSQFLANMSHEIRTPITGVIGMAELMLDLPLDDEQKEYSENIYRSANALLTVINDILDFSKVESGRLDIEEVQFSLSVIVRDVNKMLGFAAERKNLDFVADIADDIEQDLVVLGDPGRVRQIITNLLTNSIKFTSQGYVKFSVVKERDTPDIVEIKFVVEDTGIGIEEKVQRHLFQPFSQGDASTARRFGGTGLGLTICKNLLELMRGRISLESTHGAGTTATFWIPFNKPQETQGQSGLVRIETLPDRLQSDMSVSCNSSELEQLTAAAMGTAADPPQGYSGGEGGVGQDRTTGPSGVRRQRSVTISPPDSSAQEELSMAERANINVLVVEDNAINQQIAIKTIRKLGFGVSAVWNGKEALEYLSAAQVGRQAKPSIILMDVQMPVIDGYKATHVLRHHIPYKAYVRDVPIVAMTASAIQGDREKCRKAGMDDYLAKPVKRKVLERMLVRWSRPGRPTSLSVASDSSISDCSNAEMHCSVVDQQHGSIGVDDGVGVGEDAGMGMGADTGVGVGVGVGVSGGGGMGILRRMNTVTSMGSASSWNRPNGGSEEATPVGPVAGNGGADGDEPNLVTPRAIEEGSHFPGYDLQPSSDDENSAAGEETRQQQPKLRRMEDADERAMHSRDDKLVEAAGGDFSRPSPSYSLESPMPRGDSLTEENVVKLEMQETLRRKHSQE